MTGSDLCSQTDYASRIAQFPKLCMFLQVVRPAWATAVILRPRCGPELSELILACLQKRPLASDNECETSTAKVCGSDEEAPHHQRSRLRTPEEPSSGLKAPSNSEHSFCDGRVLYSSNSSSIVPYLCLPSGLSGVFLASALMPISVVRVMPRAMAYCGTECLVAVGIRMQAGHPLKALAYSCYGSCPLQHAAETCCRCPAGGYCPLGTW